VLLVSEKCLELCLFLLLISKWLTQTRQQNKAGGNMILDEKQLMKMKVEN